MTAVVVVVRPGDAHAVAHGRHDEVAAALAALVASIPGARLEAEQVVAVRADPAEALDLALRCVAAPGVAAAVGVGPVALAAGSAVGTVAARVRRLGGVARVGEVLVLDPFPAPLPDGVGGFTAPAAIRELAGGPVRALRDHR